MCFALLLSYVQNLRRFLCFPTKRPRPSVRVPQVCAKQKRPLNPAEHALVLNGKAQDLTTPVRFLNLPPSAKLELKVGAEEVQARPRLESAARLQQKLTTSR